MLEHGGLDGVAVTDHNTIDFALALQAQLGERIIVGEEITTEQGEIIGLYLSHPIAAGLPLDDAIHQIQAQGGLVYVPHPFETVRKGISAAVLKIVADNVDIIEVHNGRAVAQNRSVQAHAWAASHHVPGAASSDAHGRAGWGKTYTILDRQPTKETLVRLLATAKHRTGFPGVRALLYPKFNRLRKRANA
jgi:predicted metal-dependent phosphoesterase TrpH